MAATTTTNIQPNPLSTSPMHNKYYEATSASIFKSTTCDSQLPWSFCVHQAKSDVCDPLDRNGYGSQSSLLSDLHDFGGFTSNSPYSVILNPHEDGCANSSLATDYCLAASAGVCHSTFTTTNPNFRAVPMTLENGGLWIMLALFFTFFFGSVCLSMVGDTLGIFSEGRGNVVDRMMNRKIEQITAKMSLKTSLLGALEFSTLTLMFNDEAGAGKERAFVRIKTQNGLRPMALFIILNEVLFNSPLINFSKSANWVFRGPRLVHSLATLFMCNPEAYMNSPDLARRMFATNIFTGAVLGLVCVWNDEWEGNRVSQNGSSEWLVVGVTLYFLLLANLTPCVWIKKTAVIVTAAIMFMVGEFVFRSECYHSGDNFDYPIVSVFVSVSHFRNSCDSSQQGQTIIWQSLAVVIATAAIIASTYHSEKSDRSVFASQYGIFVNELSRQKEIERMQEALKAKELNPEQLELVLEIMSKSQHAGAPGGPDSTTNNKPARRRSSLFGGTSKAGQNGTRGSGRRGSISSVSALQQLQIKKEHIAIVEGNIGRGAFGDVHKGKYNGVFVAVKTIANVDEQNMRAFRYEIILLNQLRHPNIIMLLGAVWSKEMVGIVLEYAENGSLSDILKKKMCENWTWGEPMLSIVFDIAQGMRYMHATSYYDELTDTHQENLLHRDLKTGNVLLSSSWSAKVSDFGSTKAFGAKLGTEDMTMTGTPIYMAPEVVRGERYDKSCDVYSFGVLMFAMECKKGNVYASFEKAVKESHIDGTMLLSPGITPSGASQTGSFSETSSNDRSLSTENKSDSKNRKGGKSAKNKQFAQEKSVMKLVADDGVRPDLHHIHRGGKKLVKSLRKIIEKCWMERAKSRPTFEMILGALGGVREELAANKKNEVSRVENKIKIEDERAEARLEENKKFVENSRDHLRHLVTPMILIKADEFIKLKKLVPYETVRDTRAASLVTLDNMEKAELFLKDQYTIFFSHQWLAFSTPDPDKSQYDLMVNATRKLAKKKKMELSKVYIWVDYIGIAQESKVIQKYAIQTLPAIASSLHSFVVVAPSTPHSDLKTNCDLDTYKRRGWCRAEVLSHVARRGTSELYIATEKGELRKVDGTRVGDNVTVGERTEGKSAVRVSIREQNVDLKLVEEMSRVFLGDFTCCRMKHLGNNAVCDRELLLEPMLGLYCEIYKKRLNPKMKPIYDFIEPYKGTIYPKSIEIEFCENEKVKHERRTLFGDLLEIAERTIDYENMLIGAGMDVDAITFSGAGEANDADLAPILINKKDLVLSEVDDDDNGIEGTSFTKGTYRGHAVAVDVLELMEDDEILDEEEMGEALEKFKRECLLMKDLKHENILMLVGALWGADLTCLVLEYVEGTTANKFLKSLAPVDQTWHGPKMSVVKGMVRGMSYLHSCIFWDSYTDDYNEGVIHRNLKLDSVLVGARHDGYEERSGIRKKASSVAGHHNFNDLVVKISDFSDSRVVKRDETMTIVGHNLYMAPEVYRGERYDTKADVFSFAMCLVEIVIINSDTDDIESLLHDDFLKDTAGGGGMTVNSSSAKIVKYFQKGLVRPRVEKAAYPEVPNELFKLMQLCWEVNPAARPSFAEIKEFLGSDKMNEQILKHAKSKMMLGANEEEEEQLRVIKLELARGNVLREEELALQRKRAQDRLRERMHERRATRVEGGNIES